MFRHKPVRWACTGQQMYLMDSTVHSAEILEDFESYNRKTMTYANLNVIHLYVYLVPPCSNIMIASVSITRSNSSWPGSIRGK